MKLFVLKGFGLASDKLRTKESFVHDGVPYTLEHGDVILAAITSTTNATSSSVMLAAGNFFLFHSTACYFCRQFCLESNNRLPL